jgi:hypothetical protein
MKVTSHHLHSVGLTPIGLDFQRWTALVRTRLDMAMHFSTLATHDDPRVRPLASTRMW